MRNATEYERADHYRDERKHEDRPGDRDFPIRLETAPLSSAMDIALCVRGMDDITAAAALIDQHIKTAMSGERLDRTIESMPRRLAVSKLVGYCIGICDEKFLGKQIATSLRERIDEVSHAQT